jgi:hypothetical protein
MRFVLFQLNSESIKSFEELIKDAKNIKKTTGKPVLYLEGQLKLMKFKPIPYQDDNKYYYVDTLVLMEPLDEEFPVS